MRNKDVAFSDREKRTMERILKEIKKSKHDGMTIADLSRKLGISRYTVSKYVLFLKGAGKILERKVGVARLYYVK